MDDNPYRVFLSHGGDDGWVASQIAKAISEVGAATFLDQTNIPKGSDFKRIIHREIAASNELLALFTPWSAKRSWVWVEIGAAWGQGKPVIAVLYGIQATDLDESGQGKAILEDINLLRLNDLDSYLKELAARVNGVRNA